MIDLAVEFFRFLERLLEHQHVLSNAESIGKMIALVVAGIWTYQLFIRQRQKYPRACLKHQVLTQKLPDGRVVLLISVEVENTGNVMIKGTMIDVRVQRVFPLDEAAMQKLIEPHDRRDPKAAPNIPWDVLGHRQVDLAARQCEIEPGESDTLYFDFVIGGKTKRVRLYSHLQNFAKKKRRIGWSHASFHEVP